MSDIKVILFDLDGTLLPMDQDAFAKDYFGRLAAALMPYGYEPKKLVASIWEGTRAMVKNDGSRTNEAAFWKSFTEIHGPEAEAHRPVLDRFYKEEFDKVKASCGFFPEAAPLIHRLKADGYRIALATNPLFPSIATEKRIAWAGLSPSDFELYTTYENSRYTKPNLYYYRDILHKLGVSADECLMVGNDVGEDMVAGQLGMKLFLLTECLINKNNEDISVYHHGDFTELLSFIEE